MAVPGALIFQERALAGGQLEEPLADAVRTALSSAIANDAPPLPVLPPPTRACATCAGCRA